MPEGWARPQGPCPTPEFQAILIRKEKGNWQGVGVGFAAGQGLLANSNMAFQGPGAEG